jgi:hypothetical protein
MFAGIPAIADTVADNLPLLASLMLRASLLLFTSLMLSLQLFWRLGPCNGLPAIACVPGVDGIAVVAGFSTVADFHTVIVYVSTFATVPTLCWDPHTVGGVLDVNGIVAAVLLCCRSISSTKGEIRLQRARLVYVGDSSTSMKGRLVWVTRLQRARLVYGGEDSSMGGRLRSSVPLKVVRSCILWYKVKASKSK